MSPARSDERGSASILLVALSGLLSVFAALALSVGAVAVARHRAASAADLAALAAAARWAGGQSAACASAGDVARAGGAVLARCRVDGDVAQVLAEAPLPGGLARLGVARAAARAGPVGVEVTAR